MAYELKASSCDPLREKYFFVFFGLCSPRHYPYISPSDRELIVKSTMDTEMEYHAFDCCRRACEWYTKNGERVKYIVDEFDKEHNRGWNGILGENFASGVHHGKSCYIRIKNFGKNNLQILLFRC